MSSLLLRQPSHLHPATALKLSQQAPAILASSPGGVSSSTMQSLFAAPETQELWITYENLLLSCLRTGDIKAAEECLERLIKRFGEDNERIMALSGLSKEAVAEDNAALQTILDDYSKIIEANSANIPIAKRRVALLRSMGKTAESVAALNSLLAVSPTDAEAWSELSDLYFSQGLYSQAIFALEEVVVLQPNAWNIHARLGELLLMSSKVSGQPETPKQVAEALKRFCRSIELCDYYLRGYYGLKLCAKQLLDEPQKAPKNAEDWAPPDSSTLRRLDEVATEKLAEIVRRNSAGETGWRGYDEGEIAAARDLLDKDADTTAK